MDDMVNITFLVDLELKKQAEQIFNELGIDMTTAINIFLREVVRQQRIPFEYADIMPNVETIDDNERG